MNKKNVYLFDRVLKYYGMTKKEFAMKSAIPYDTVAGWKRSGHVPSYAFVLLKTLAFTENPRKNQITLSPVRHTKMTATLTKEIEVAFWGKNYASTYILKEVKKGNPSFVKPFFENVFYGDIIKLLPTKAIEKLLPEIENLFKRETTIFWKNVVKMYRDGGLNVA